MGWEVPVPRRLLHAEVPSHPSPSHPHALRGPGGVQLPVGIHWPQLYVAEGEERSERFCWAMVAYTFNPSPQEAETESL